MMLVEWEERKEKSEVRVELANEFKDERALSVKGLSVCRAKPGSAESQVPPHLSNELTSIELVGVCPPVTLTDVGMLSSSVVVAEPDRKSVV